MHTDFILIDSTRLGHGESMIFRLVELAATNSTSQDNPTSQIVPLGNIQIMAVLIAVTIALVIARVLLARRQKAAMGDA